MTINEFNQNYKKLTKKQVMDFVATHQHEDLPMNTLGKIFEIFFINPKTGITYRDVPVWELRALHHSFEINNGNSWGLRDSKSYLGRRFNIVNHCEGRRTVSISTNGFRTTPSNPASKKISLVTLQDLQETAADYSVLMASLTTNKDTLSTEIRLEITDKKNCAEIRMLDIIKQIAGTL